MEATEYNVFLHGGFVPPKLKFANPFSVVE